MFGRPYRLLVYAVLTMFLLAACGQQAATSAPTAAPAEATTAPAEATTAPAEATTAPAEATTAPAESNGARGTIKIGSKDFTEAILVAEMEAQLLENAGFTVDRKLNLGATPIAQGALVKGDIDLYPEYTSTGLQEVLKVDTIPQNADEIYQTVKKGYEDKFQLTWLQPAPFSDTNTFATTQEIADKYNLKTFSDLAANAANLRLGGPAEFPDRQDTKHLEEVYGPFIGKFKEFKQLGTGTLRYDALKNGDVDVIVAFTTDGRIAGDKLVVLKDDKNAYPIYQIAPVIRQDTLQKYPDIAPVLNKLAPLLTESVMSDLNYQVDGPDKKEPADVARAFLQQSGLLK